MSRFTAPLVVTPTEDYKGWVVLSSSIAEDIVVPESWGRVFGYDIGKEGSGLSVEIPHGFVTDFASIPWFARWLIPTWGRHTNAAIIHDYLYRGGQMISTKYPLQSKIPPTRADADQIMLEAMEVMRVRKWMRLAIYYGLRIGGWWAWRKNRES